MKDKRNPNVEDYVLLAKSVLPLKLCKDLIKELNKNKKEWFEHGWTQRTSKGVISLKGNSKFELANCYLNTPNHDELMKTIKTVVSSYLNHFNYPWFSEFSGYSKIRYNIYRKNNKHRPSRPSTSTSPLFLSL